MSFSLIAPAIEREDATRHKTVTQLSQKPCVSPLDEGQTMGIRPLAILME
jgi:hypothetical protein